METSAAVWGLVPRPDIDPLLVVRRLRALGPHRCTAALTVVPSGHTAEPPALRPRRMALVPSDTLQIGTLDWAAFREIFEEASVELQHPAQRATAAMAARSLRQIEDAQQPTVEYLRA